jgi:hypothetical protein
VTEREFQTAASVRVQNGMNQPRWGSSDWHDTKLATG